MICSRPIPNYSTIGSGTIFKVNWPNECTIKFWGPSTDSLLTIFEYPPTLKQAYMVQC